MSRAAIRTSPDRSDAQNSSSQGEVARGGFLRRALGPGVEIGPGTVDRTGQPLGIDRLHQIVDRRNVERGHRELVEGGDEHDGGRPALARQGAGDLDPVLAGHCDIEQHHVGL